MFLSSSPCLLMRDPTAATCPLITSAPVESHPAQTQTPQSTPDLTVKSQSPAPEGCPSIDCHSRLVDDMTTPSHGPPGTCRRLCDGDFLFCLAGRGS